MSLKAGASAAGWLGASVGAAALGGLKGFQGLDGHRRGSSATTSVPGEAECLAAVVSSSEDSSLAKGVVVGGGGVWSAVLSGVQPGGRRLMKVWEEMHRGSRYGLKIRSEFKPTTLRGERFKKQGNSL